MVIEYVKKKLEEIFENKVYGLRLENNRVKFCLPYDGMISTKDLDALNKYFHTKEIAVSIKINKAKEKIEESVSLYVEIKYLEI